jgi:hypothetical protein
MPAVSCPGYGKTSARELLACQQSSQGSKETVNMLLFKLISDRESAAFSKELIGVPAGGLCEHICDT